MDGYTRNPRSHFRAAPPPPSSAAAGTAYYKKGLGNGAAVAGGNGFTAYDDVFGGPPKFGATPFAPRAEDYSEIFGSFRSSRSSSIPMLDLPPVDDSVAAFEVVGCSGMEYSDIFGGFDFGDFAASYDELFRRSDGSEESSDDAWYYFRTPVGTESPSGESPYASSGRNKYFLDGDFHETLEDKVFDFSYHNVNLGTTENLEHIYEPQPSSFPVYAYEAEGSDMRKEGEERYSSGVADDIILCEDSSGNISVEAPWKTASIHSHRSVVKESNEYGEKAGGTHGISLSPGFVSFSDVSLRTESPHLPPVSGLPPTIVDRKKDPASSISDYEKSKTSTIETIFGGGSFDFIDVELSAGSSSFASAAAIKEAMDRAKVKINNAKELRKRKKDSVKDMLFTNNDLNSDGKVTMVFDETILGGDELHLKDKRDSNVVKTSGENMQFSSNASEVLPDPLTEGDGEWKVTTECFELVNNGNSNAETTLLDSIKKPVQEMNGCHNIGTANGKTMHVKKPEPEVVGDDAFMKEHEGSESADEACNPRENRRRLRAGKAASRNAFHEKMVKLAQDVHETVISGHVETMKSRKGFEGDEATQKPEMHTAEERKERRFEQAADQVYYDRNQNEDFYLAGSELGSDEDLVLADTDEKRKEACGFKENERRGTEVAAREETPEWVEEFAEREDNGRELNDAHPAEEKEETCLRKGAEAMKRVLSPRDENLSVLDEVHVQKEGKGKPGRNEQQDNNVRLKKAHEEINESENIVCENGPHKTDQYEENAAVSDCYQKSLREEAQNFEKHELATGNISEDAVNAANDLPTVSKGQGKSYGTYSKEDEVDAYEEVMEEPVQAYEFNNSQMDGCWAINEEQKMKNKVDLLSELKTSDQDSNQKRNMHIESECFISTLDEVVPEMACENEKLESFTVSSSADEEMIISSEFTSKCEERLENRVAEDMPINKEKADFKSECLYGEVESEVADTADVCKLTKHTQKTEANQPLMSERKESIQKQYPSSHTNQRVGIEMKAVNDDDAAKDREMAKKLKRKEESDRERLKELQLEKERERERELEAQRVRKLEEEREKEREKLRLRRLEEIREREREKELEKDHLRKLEEERQRERENDLEKERLRKLEEEWEREREREKDRMGVELKRSAAHERASLEIRERAERAALERATAEARQRAMAEARERLEKACAEAREKSMGKTSKESQLRAERAAVERATAEARERAMEKAMAESATFGTRERVERSVSEKFSTSFRDVGLRNCSSSSDLWNSDKSDGVESESAQRCRARLERHRRTVDRVAKALAEKNMRDLIAQREQAERNRFAETLDADIKRWSNGKEGNLRALLSTLQYILGPESGWQSIPLTEVITSAAVKKAYRKATLCVHPDKLQQRGATIQQKMLGTDLTQRRDDPRLFKGHNRHAHSCKYIANKSHVSTSACFYFLIIPIKWDFGDPEKEARCVHPILHVLSLASFVA
ncbi:hypothetical protein V2J09_021836 [Rumex salicifolius]